MNPAPSRISWEGAFGSQNASNENTMRIFTADDLDQFQALIIEQFDVFDGISYQGEYYDTFEDLKMKVDHDLQNGLLVYFYEWFNQMEAEPENFTIHDFYMANGMSTWLGYVLLATKKTNPSPITERMCSRCLRVLPKDCACDCPESKRLSIRTMPARSEKTPPSRTCPRCGAEIAVTKDNYSVCACSGHTGS